MDVGALAAGRVRAGDARRRAVAVARRPRARDPPQRLALLSRRRRDLLLQRRLEHRQRTPSADVDRLWVDAPARTDRALRRAELPRRPTGGGAAAGSRAAANRIAARVRNRRAGGG